MTCHYCDEDITGTPVTDEAFPDLKFCSSSCRDDCATGME